MTAKMNTACRQFHSNLEIALSKTSALKSISDETVHDVRKVLKKARADLRLLRQGIKEAAYRQENTILRDAGRSLRAPRDAKSLIDAFDSFCRRVAGQLPGAKLAPFRRQLNARRSAADVSRTQDF